MDTNELVRFEDKVLRIPESGCWIWTGTVDGSGYGGIKIRGKLTKAHRLSYEHYVGKIQPELEIDHLCRVRCCVNPEHLDQVTRSENLKRSPILNRTHRKDIDESCVNGHSWTPENTYINDKGHRFCRKCRAECEKQRRAKAKWG